VKVLVVDDSEVVLHAIRRALERPADAIETASNGADALALFERFEPDAVTLDLSMPGMDGLSCMDAMLERRPGTRILVITAVADKATAVEAVRRGARGFLFKPFTNDELNFEIGDLFV
jgi:two-component system chemotaxis response regulator CheY